MLSLIFYLIVLLAIGGVIFLLHHKRKHKKRKSQVRIFEPKINLDSPEDLEKDKIDKVSQSLRGADEPQDEVLNGDLGEAPEGVQNASSENISPYSSDLIVLHVNAFDANPYMGYELHQTLLSADLRFGDMNIFHRYGNDDQEVLFSLAAATPEGSFMIEDMGSFKCFGLVLFMKLDPKQKLMASFDLMLDTARQLAEELGGEIYDDLRQSISADVIKRLRERICRVETSNLYASDLLDNLDD